jgi:hypothetical protein
MNDDELRRLLQGALSSRRVPAETRERLLQTLHRRRRSAWLAAAAAALLVGLVSAALLLPGDAPAPPVLRDAVRHHVEARTFGHAASDRSEIAEMVGEACGREVEVPALRDGGFVQMQAHGCERMGGVHVIYANSWLKASCFVLSTCTAGFDAGRLVSESGVQARVWEIDGHSVVAVPEGDVVKVWVADLRPAQLSAIAVDTELKRFQVKTAVFTVKDAAISGPLRATLRATPGVEEVRLEDSRNEAVIRYDRRRISPDELAAMMVLNGFPAGPREWGGR